MYYLDNAATTRPFQMVVEKMLPFLTESYGNAGSTHQLGREAAKAVCQAREYVAAFLGAQPEQIIFTSGGSEANTLAICGAEHCLDGSFYGNKSILTSQLEHESVLNAATHTANRAKCATVLFANPKRDGTVPAENVGAKMDGTVALVSLMYVNNETGSINPVDDIATLCMKRGIPFHTDCVQAAGCLPLNVKTIGCNFLSISSHKIHGPKGVGALFVSDKSMLEPLIHGSRSQEFGLRGGTENVAGIVGFGEACRIYMDNWKAFATKTEAVKQVFYTTLRKELGDSFTVNGQNVLSPGKILSLTFQNVDAQTLLLMLDAKGVCVSTGSACNAHSMEPSRVLKSIGMSDEQAHSTIRVSFSALNKEEEIICAAKIMAECVNILRATNTGDDIRFKKPDFTKHTGDDYPN